MAFFEEWDPWEEEKRIREFMRRIMGSFWRPWREFREELRYESFPIDLAETDDELILRADLPGFDKDNLKIRITDNTIDITAQKKEEKKEISERMYRRERSMGSLRRFLTLPVEVNPDEVEAKFDKGVLTVRMKKKKVKKGKEIKIK